jgi:hypothetical protein
MQRWVWHVSPELWIVCRLVRVASYRARGGVALAEGGQIWPRIGALDQMARASSANATGS